MAENTENNENPQASEASATEVNGKKSGSMLIWIIAGLMAVIGGGGGFFVATIIASQGQDEQVQEQIEKPLSPEEEMGQLLSDVSGEVFDYPLDAVVACLDEPSLSRYVRATIILRMEEGFDPVAGEAFLESKKYLLNDWLTTYLAGLSLVQVQGSRNLERVKMEIYEEFNQILFPNKKPLVKKILFKEFVVN